MHLFRTAFLILFVFCGCSPTTTEQENTFCAGAASVNINPAPGMYIAGDAQNRTFSGIHDSLYVKALVVHDGAMALAMVTINCIGLMYPDIQEIRSLGAEMARMPGLSANRIIVASDHIHSGPDVVGIWGPSQTESGRDSVYMDFLIQQSALAIKKASENMVPAQVRTAEGEFGMEWVHNISEPDEIDRALTVLHFTTMEGSTIATLTNFACHPTFYDAVQDEISADYVGAFTRDIKEAMGGEHLFLQGAIGGWVQPDKEDQSYAVGAKRGQELSRAVQDLLLKATPLPSSMIGFRNRKFTIPVTNEGWQQLVDIGVIDRKIEATVDTEMAWFSLGPAQFITHPGETPPAYSLQSKEWMGTGPKFVIGLGMDALGYILKPEYFENEEIPHAEYLTRMSVGKDAGPLVLKTARELILNE